LRVALAAMDATLQRKQHELVTRERQIDESRVNVERLRRRLDGLF